MCDPFTADMLACRDAFLLAFSKGWSHALDGDRLSNNREGMDGEKEQRSSSSQLVIEMKSVVSFFQAFSISFVKERSE